MKNIVMTGASSMLGVALIQECVNKSIRVTAVVRPGSVKKNRIPASKLVNIVECGLDGIEKVPVLAQGGFDAFYHLGWAHTDKEGRNDALKQKANVDYTLNAVKAAKQMKCAVFVGAGSQAEYGRVAVAIRPDMQAKPETAYGTAKYSAGKLSGALCKQLGIKHVWTRIFSVYGPNDDSSTMIMYCIDKLLKKEKPLLTKCGQIWDYLYCSDAARALLLAGEKGRDQTVYNIGSGIGRPLSEFVNIIRDIVAPGIEPGIGAVGYAKNQVMHLCADISGLRNDTGFSASVTFEDGITKTVQWYKEKRL